MANDLKNVEKQLTQFRKDLGTITNNQKVLNKSIAQVGEKMKSLEQNLAFITQSAQTIMTLYNENSDEIGKVVKQLSNQLKAKPKPVVETEEAKEISD